MPDFNVVQVVSGGELVGVVDISAGAMHTCAVKNDSTVWCWGAGANGQLGNGLTIDATRAMEVRDSGGAALSGAVAVAAGTSHTCVLRDDDTVWCWGAGRNGQLGDGATSDSTVPVQVMQSVGVALEQVVRITAGDMHTCAVKNDGTVWCWGMNYYGQIGTGDYADASRPVEVTTRDGTYITDVVDISAGAMHTCAVRTDGTVWCWGSNRRGQLGMQAYGEESVPYAVPVSDWADVPLGDIRQVRCGFEFSCAEDDSGQVWCWGDNGVGQLGRAIHNPYEAYEVYVLNKARP